MYVIIFPHRDILDFEDQEASEFIPVRVLCSKHQGDQCILSVIGILKIDQSQLLDGVDPVGDRISVNKQFL